jgi:hypothetical protein
MNWQKEFGKVNIEGWEGKEPLFEMFLNLTRTQIGGKI